VTITKLLAGARQFTTMTLLMTSVGSLAGAQDGTGRVRGKVTNAASGAAVPNAQVLITSEKLGAVSGIDGTYLITNVPPGARTVRVRALGYQVIDKAVAVTANGTTTVDFIVVAAPIALNEIE